MTRQQQRANVRNITKKLGYIDSGHDKAKVGPGRQNKWLARHPKIGGFYAMAVGILQNGDRAQRPSWKAIRKTMLLLATQPRVRVIGVGDRLPFMLTQNRHERGAWRSYPHITLDANLKVS